MMETERNCKNCKFLATLKHNFVKGKGYEESLCCIAFTKVDVDEKDIPMIVETHLDGECEMFANKV